MEFDEEPTLSGDVLMPAQFYSAVSATPSQRLLVAILEDAICCFQKNCGARNTKRQILFREAETWLFDRHSNGFLSSQAVCESLEIDLVQLRRYLRKWKLNKRASSAALPGRMASNIEPAGVV
jgi:hypothetical protein